MEGLHQNIKKKYSYADYLTWPSDERWEIINGKLYSMSSPSDIHQNIITQLLTELNLYFRGKKCRVYPAPFDVRLPENKLDSDDKIYNVVQPDIIVICNMEKISSKGCNGAPDIVIEVLSPSTASKDHIKKRILYEKNLVNQYWIVSPEEKLIYIYKLGSNQTYKLPEEYQKNNKIKVEGFDGLEIDLSIIFQEV